MSDLNFWGSRLLYIATNSYNQAKEFTSTDPYACTQQLSASLFSFTEKASQTVILHNENGDFGLINAWVNLCSMPLGPVMIGEAPAEWQSSAYLNEIPFCRVDLLSRVLCVLDPRVPL